MPVITNNVKNGLENIYQKNKMMYTDVNNNHIE